MVRKLERRLESRPTPAAIRAFPGAKLCSRRVASRSPHVALLNDQFLNDHEDLEPTTGAERARIALIASIFKAKLEASGRYTFVSIPADAASKIAAGPEVGPCGGCEFGYGKELGADYVAWIAIQKVSDLILNINVYMADVG